MPWRVVSIQRNRNQPPAPSLSQGSLRSPARCRREAEVPSILEGAKEEAGAWWDAETGTPSLLE